jgi:RNA recognition motif-containing protein
MLSFAQLVPPDMTAGNTINYLLIAVGIALAAFTIGLLAGMRVARSKRHKSRSSGNGKSRKQGGSRSGSRQTTRGNQNQRSSGDGGSQDSSGPREAEIYAGNLSYDVEDDDLTALFAKYGTVSSVRIIQNRFNGRSKGFGFVSMPNKKECKAAVEALNGFEFEGRKLVVNEARSKARD